MSQSDVNFVFLDLLKYQVKKILKFTFEIAEEKIGHFKIVKATG